MLPVPGLDPRSQKAGEFCSKFLYEGEYDQVVKQAVRHGQSLDEVLEHSTIDKIWKLIVTPEASAVQQDAEQDAAREALEIVGPRECCETGGHGAFGRECPEASEEPGPDGGWIAQPGAVVEAHAGYGHFQSSWLFGLKCPLPVRGGGCW